MPTIPESSSPEDAMLQNEEIGVEENDTPVTLAIVPDHIGESKNLITCIFCQAEQYRLCLKCERPFCFIHSSNFSPAFCQECFHKLNLIKDTFIRNVDDWNPITESLFTRKETCKQLRIDGPDWTFFTKWINKLSDEDLEVVYDFHFFVKTLIEGANEARKVNRRERIKTQVVPKSVTSTTTTTEKRTRKTTVVTDLRSILKKRFPAFTEEMIDRMIAAGGGK